MFNIADYLYLKLNQIKEIANMEDYTIKCYEEQEFAVENVKEKEISIVIKRMTSSLTFNTITQPMQILILSEENSSEKTFALMNKFATDNNWMVITEGTSKYKLQFSQPMVMSNFEVVGAGYRSVLFISANTYELQNAADIENNTIKIDGNDVKIISMSVGYGANMNTEQFPLFEIAKSIKTTAALTLTLTIPCQINTFSKKCLEISFGDYTGNQAFNFKFTIGGEDGVECDKNLRLVSCNFTTAAGDIPALTMAFME